MKCDLNIHIFLSIFFATANYKGKTDSWEREDVCTLFTVFKEKQQNTP